MSNPKLRTQAFLTVTFALMCSCTSATEAYDLNGVWTQWPSVAENSVVDAEYSWGSGISVRNGSIDIDLGTEPATLRFGYLGGRFPIQSVNRVSDESYKIIFTFTRGGFDVEWTITFLDTHRIYVEQQGEGLEISGFFGPEHIQYRIDGPTITDPPRRVD